MALSQKLQDAINEQINAEFYSSYLYLAMAGHLTAVNMPGCARWMRMQAHEELLHAIKLADYLLERQATLALPAIAAPPATWTSVLAVFEASYTHEQEVTRRINALIELAIGQRDRATENLLRWFVDEQVEEEATLDELLHKFKLVGESGSGLFLLDRELGTRAAPTAPNSAG